MRVVLLCWLALALGCPSESAPPPGGESDDVAATSGDDTATETDISDVASADVLEHPDDSASPSDQGPPSDDGPPGEPGECVEKYSKTCNDDNEVIWLDSCGQPGWVFEICGSAEVCEFGACAEICEPMADKQCMGGNVFWLDSCGEPAEVAQACTQEEFCEGAACVESDVLGTWIISAQPPKKPMPGFYDSVYPTGELLLVLQDGAVKTTLAGAPFEGALDGKKLTLSGTWLESGTPPVEHIATLSIEFGAPGQFWGIQTEDLKVQGMPAGKLTWDISGVRP